MKKILSFIMAVAVMLTVLIVPKTDVFADGTYKLHIDDKTHSYEAYQIFAGTLSSTGELSNIEWGNGVAGNETALLTALKAETGFGTNPFSDCDTAEKVAKVLGESTLFNGTDKDKNLALFAKIVSGKLNASNKNTGSAGTDTYDIVGLNAGYYLVKDITSIDGVENGANSRFILNITQDTTIASKPVYPTVKKNIIENDNKVEENTATVGDVINYQLDSKVPDMTGYNKYYFIIQDKLSKGLSFNDDPGVSVRIKTAEPNTWKTLASTEFAVTKSGTDPMVIKIVLNNFIQYQPYASMPIEVKYSATLNENAIVGKEGSPKGNPNTVNLIYSNDPTHEYIGANEPGDPTDVTGITPDSTVTTYTYQIKLTKIDGAKKGEFDQALTGAKFKIAGTSEKKVVVITDTFVEDVGGTYYKLADGTYTTTAPIPATATKYESTTKKYIKSETKTEKTLTAGELTEEQSVGADGVLCFSHLGVGTFTITETTAPEGYNQIAPFKVQIKSDGTYSILDKDGNATAVNNVAIGTDGIIKYTVENNKGVVLPSTGGIGTTIFYVVGGILVLVAGVLLITKKRMER